MKINKAKRSVKPAVPAPTARAAGPAEADIGALIADLATKDPVRRETARTRLVSLGTPAVPALIECLADRRRRLRWEAAKALSEIADPAAAGVLLRALDDEDSDVRWLAAMGLAALGLEGLRLLLLALQARPDSLWLREGAHHVCHELARQSLRLAGLVRPLQMALDCPEPETVIPLATYALLTELQKSSQPGRRTPSSARARRS